MHITQTLIGAQCYCFSIAGDNIKNMYIFLLSECDATGLTEEKHRPTLHYTTLHYTT